MTLDYLEMRPDTIRTRKLRTLETAESFAVLEDDPSASAVEPLPRNLSLSLTLRRGRLALLVVTTLACVVALTLVFRGGGVELGRFNKADKSSRDTSRLLDKYNAYSGTAASALGRPLEFGMALFVQVIVLRVMAAATLQRAKPSWKVGIAVLVLGATAGFLLNNAFNALNVQVVELPLQLVMTDSDLVSPDALNASTVLASTSSESSHQNPSTNTVLRNLLAPRVPKSPPQCRLGNPFNRQLLDDVVDFGISSSDWMKQTLPRALTPTTLTIVINSSEPSANANVRGDQLPMAPSVAADLLLTAVLTGGRYINWGKISPWTEDAIANKSFPTSSSQPVRYEAAARTSGLLPPDATASDTAQRDWFVRESGPYVGRYLWNATGLMASTDIPMEFSRVQITSQLVFDAVSIKLTVDSKRMPASFTSADKTKRYYAVSPQQRAISPTIVFVPKVSGDMGMQLVAMGACMNANGTETLQSTLQLGKRFVDYNIDCPAQSNASLLFLTTAKRFEADALVGNATANSTGVYRGSQFAGVVENLRLVYTLTVGRLSWTLQDLATDHGATCGSRNGCKGLALPLTSTDGKQQQLVAGAHALPLDFAPPIKYNFWAGNATWRALPLVTIIQPNNADLVTTNRADNSTQQWNVAVGDLLLPHNIKNLSVDTSRGRLVGTCSIVQEDRQHVVVHSHAYIEDPLQATYTAAVFFLFKNGVVRDVLRPSTPAKANAIQALALDGNVQLMKIVASVPDQNAMITIAGCVLLLCGLAAVLVLSGSAPGDSTDPFQNITMPHVMARVLLDDQRFPPLLLHRRVAVHGSADEDAEQFVIQNLTLQKTDTSPDAQSNAGVQV